MSQISGLSPLALLPPNASPAQIAAALSQSTGLSGGPFNPTIDYGPTPISGLPPGIQGVTTGPPPGLLGLTGWTPPPGAPPLPTPGQPYVPQFPGLGVNPTQEQMAAVLARFGMSPDQIAAMSGISDLQQRAMDAGMTTADYMRALLTPGSAAATANAARMQGQPGPGVGPGAGPQAGGSPSFFQDPASSGQPPGPSSPASPAAPPSYQFPTYGGQPSGQPQWLDRNALADPYGTAALLGLTGSDINTYGTELMKMGKDPWNTGVYIQPYQARGSEPGVMDYNVINPDNDAALQRAWALRNPGVPWGVGPNPGAAQPTGYVDPYGGYRPSVVTPQMMSPGAQDAWRTGSWTPPQAWLTPSRGPQPQQPAPQQPAPQQPTPQQPAPQPQRSSPIATRAPGMEGQPAAAAVSGSHPFVQQISRQLGGFQIPTPAGGWGMTNRDVWSGRNAFGGFSPYGFPMNTMGMTTGGGQTGVRNLPPVYDPWGYGRPYDPWGGVVSQTAGGEGLGFGFDQGG